MIPELGSEEPGCIGIVNRIPFGMRIFHFKEEKQKP